MKKIYHILNGDALKEQFPVVLEGEIIIARECLVDGDVKSSSLEELFLKRAKYLNSIAPQASLEDYMMESAGEFRKIQAIRGESEVNLWFEDDLFCQVNFWFICHLLNERSKDIRAFLVRPSSDSPYSFAAFSQPQLRELYNSKKKLKFMDRLASLWLEYQDNNAKAMLSISKEVRAAYPFIEPAVQAHLERPSRPIKAVRQIIKELKTRNFVTVFREFSKREAIYGFGDLQVKRMYEKVVQELE